MLLSLPQAAATVMSADPAVARVQPASPTSLFLMGVDAGRTTVMATPKAGTAIAQYRRRGDARRRPARAPPAAAAAARHRRLPAA